MKKLLLLFLIIAAQKISHAQLFTKITDVNNPIVTDGVETFYEGASWIDYDNDGWLDLYVTRKALYHNNGDGSFTKITSSGLKTNAGIGNTWSDYDNDGDIDCFIAGGFSKGSFLYTNNGNGTFTRNASGPLFDSLLLRGWSAAWGDYDNDGKADVAIVAPLGFADIDDGNKLLHNEGGGSFIRNEATVITQGMAPYTVGSWYDYDLDGDQDFFIGAGPVDGNPKPDYLYKNLLKETGNATFDFSIPAPLSTDARDGQNWNWIDYDNDGDLDGYVTNYVGTNVTNGYPNDFYRNDNGVYTKLTATDAGAIVSDAYTSLSNLWEDFDNDGDLDCIVINDGTDPNIYYRNNIIETGSKVFTKIINEPFYTSQDGPSFSATAGDYDKDGDPDLFVSAGSSAKGLYRNDENNGNTWVNIRLEGVQSNRSALGTVVRARATINGNVVWQMRIVNAQNTFNGMNSLNVEFGFGDAAIIDSVIINWPSGIKDVTTQVAVNDFYYALEGSSLSVVGIYEQQNVTDIWMEVFPNPAEQTCRVRTVPPKKCNGKIYLCDLYGKTIQVIYEGSLLPQHCEFDFYVDSLSPGIYICRFESEGLSISRELAVIK